MKFTNFFISAVASLLVVSSASATTLTFDGLGLNNYDDIPGTYGDRIGTTPNVVVEYRTVNIATETTGSDHLDFWNTGYGDLLNVAYSPDSAGFYGEISFTADPGFEVVLESFDLAGYSMRTYDEQPVFVLDNLGGDVYSYNGPILGSDGTHSSFTVNFSGPTVIVRFGNNWNIGIDNVVFSQRTTSKEIPEPATMLLGLVGVPFLRRKFAKNA